MRGSDAAGFGLLDLPPTSLRGLDIDHRAHFSRQSNAAVLGAVYIFVLILVALG